MRVVILYEQIRYKPDHKYICEKWKFLYFIKNTKIKQ
jgi:hypothetical protein